jgi:hypothetical protein
MRTAAELNAEAAKHEARARTLRMSAAKARKAEEDAARKKAAEIPVDRDAVTLTTGEPVTPDHREINPATGQQKGYVVLSAEERAKGFVRPVRRSYIHDKCGVLTTMGQSLAETYARDPYFYSGTFCCGCGAHFPAGEDGEFKWEDGERVGT